MPLTPHVIDTKKISSMPFSGIQGIGENFNGIQKINSKRKPRHYDGLAFPEAHYRQQFAALFSWHSVFSPAFQVHTAADICRALGVCSPALRDSNLSRIRRNPVTHNRNGCIQRSTDSLSPNKSGLVRAVPCCLQGTIYIDSDWNWFSNSLTG